MLKKFGFDEVQEALLGVAGVVFMIGVSFFVLDEFSLGPYLLGLFGVLAVLILALVPFAPGIMAPDPKATASSTVDDDDLGIGA